MKRIRVAPAYTDETGALLGIIPSKPAIHLPENSAPIIDATVAPDNAVNVTFVKGKSDGVLIQTAVDKGDWTEQGRFVKSPAGFTVPQNEASSPRSVQIRARFLDGNNAVGGWSDIVTVKTIP